MKFPRTWFNRFPRTCRGNPTREFSIFNFTLAMFHCGRTNYMRVASYTHSFIALTFSNGFSPWNAEHLTIFFDSLKQRQQQRFFLSPFCILPTHNCIVHVNVDPSSIVGKRRTGIATTSAENQSFHLSPFFFFLQLTSSSFCPTPTLKIAYMYKLLFYIHMAIYNLNGVALFRDGNKDQLVLQYLFLFLG